MLGKFPILGKFPMGGKLSMDGKVPIGMGTLPCMQALEKKIGYTSRFVRVILAQGPC